MEDAFYSASSEETEQSTSKELLEDRAKLGDTPQSVLLYTPESVLLHTPEMDHTPEVTSSATEEQPSSFEYYTDETSIYYPSEDEEDEMSDTDDPNLSGLSLLDPDPSLGCLPRFPKQRSTTWSYVTPEEAPQLRAWKYLMRRKIIELLEAMTAEIFFHRFSSPIDYMIEATEQARQKHLEKEIHGRERRSTKGIDRGGGDHESTSTLKDEDRSGASVESDMILFPSQEEYINDVILVPAQNDVSDYDAQGKTDDVTSVDVEKKKVEKRKTREEDRWSVVTLTSDVGDVGDYDVGGITCFPVDPSPLADLEREECDVSSLAEDQSPRLITSTEALQLLSYLS